MLSNKLISTHIQHLKHRAQQIANFILPAACVMCRQRATQPFNLCDACRYALPSLPQHCFQCAQFLTYSDTHARRCGNCLMKPPPFDRTFALFPYEDAAIYLIHRLKFQGALSHSTALGELMAQQVTRHWYAQTPLPNLIVPVPLHPKRLAERGFNQAIEIARPLHQRLHIPIDYNGLRRIKHTEAQSGLSADKRRRNIAHAFTAKNSYCGLTIAILDDVMTTGHTISACCEALKKAGAAQIHVWCCARAG